MSSTCKLDHTLEDVKKKLAEQSSHLPNEIMKHTELYLQKGCHQKQLNELFHLLKKYDLASEEDKKIRNEKFFSFLTI
ncbi:hypothetical protein [Bacillus weihaiensis]|uniref:Group-specific protein n=1 Tax=Bacillus weihaiensis TaxID=1547283 RepID=A0A1L3MR19_9BACI|nr:hypothetical protein [Bacillus weihaiensis]APH04815.1 hypothetical protein A9C19_08685 [Bacillus weihaiensis]